MQKVVMEQDLLLVLLMPMIKAATAADADDDDLIAAIVGANGLTQMQLVLKMEYMHKYF